MTAKRLPTFLFRMRVFSEDIDAFGIVHHANFIKFLERARVSWLLHLGFRLDELLARDIFFVIKRIDIEYFSVAKLYDELEIVSKIINQRRVAKTYEQIIRSPYQQDLQYCRAMVEVVCVNKKMRPQAMPQELMEKINDN